jgi:hypothetical protein
MSLLALLVAACLGCGGGGDAAPTTAAATDAPGPQVTTRRAASARAGTGEERRYIASVGEWLTNAAGTAGDCRAGLVSIAGEAPSARMEQVAADAVAVCRAFQRGDAGAQAQSDEVAQTLFDYEFAFGENRALPTRGGRVDVSRVEPRFSRAATVLAGKRTEARCWSPRDWQRVAAEGTPYVEGDGGANELAGFASIDDYRLQLAPEVCAPLVDLAYGARRTRWDGDIDTAFAVVALAHETRHRSGVELEAATECYALQDARRAAVLLGASQAYADGLADAYWREIYPRNTGPYFSEDCRDGGGLDLHPGSSRWP